MAKMKRKVSDQISKEVYRLQKELYDSQSLPEDQIAVHLVENNIYNWKAYIRGPDETPYEGGYFTLSISVPNSYPYTPPKIKFITKIWHPNISSQTGAICLDVLKSTWSPAMTIRTALLSIQALLGSPEPDSPQDWEVAKMYKKDFELFKSTAIAWTNMFANKLQDTKEQKINKITEMGFTHQQAEEALQTNDWDETAALNQLLGS